MAKTKKAATDDAQPPAARRERHRPNAVIVDMDAEIRAMLESVKDAIAAERKGESVSLSSTVRGLIVAEFKARNLKLRRR